jgi:hypothetical protein
MYNSAVFLTCVSLCFKVVMVSTASVMKIRVFLGITSYIVKCFTLISFLAYYSTLKMVAIRSSEKSVDFQRTTLIYILEYKSPNYSNSYPHEWSASRPGRFTHSTHCIGGWVGPRLHGEEKILDLTGTRTPTRLSSL